MLTFRFDGANGCMEETEVLTSGMVGKEVKLEFSSDWDGLTKTAVFMAGPVTRDVVGVSDVVTIPAEVLAAPMQQLYVGVYGVSEDGRVTPTIRVAGPRIDAGADPSGDEGTDPELPVWAQLQVQIDDLKDTIAEENEDSEQNPTVDMSGYAKIEDLPTRVSELENDAGFLTEHQDISGKADIKNVWVDIETDQTVGKLVYGVVGGNIATADNASGRYAMVDVSGYTKLRAEGYQWTASYNYNMVSFTDMDGKILAVYTPTDNTSVECELDIPDGAKYAYITGRDSVEISASGYKFYDIAVLAEEKADKYSIWVDPPKTVVTGKLAYASGGTMDYANGRYTTVEVAGYKKVRCLGYQHNKNYFSVCMFYDKDGTLISDYQGATNDSRATFELDVPSNAHTFKLNSHPALAALEYVKLYKPMSIKELYADLKPIGKKLITLGDSITALGTTATGWVNYFIEKTGCELVANTAVNSAVLSDYAGTVYDGAPSASTQTNNVLGNQVQQIINNGYDTPDIILIAIGTNGGISITEDQIKAAYYDSNNTLIPLEDVDRTTNAGAYRWCLEKLHATYPDALIFWCTPIMGYQATRSAENAMAYAESLRIATEYTGQVLIDTIRCGINGVNEVSGANGQYLIDGLHPNVNGAKKIGYYNASKVLPFLGNSFGLS